MNSGVFQSGLLGAPMDQQRAMYHQQHALYSGQRQHDWERRFLAVGAVESMPNKKIDPPKLNEEVALCSKHLWLRV